MDQDKLFITPVLEFRLEDTCRAHSFMGCSRGIHSMSIGIKTFYTNNQKSDQAVIGVMGKLAMTWIGFKEAKTVLNTTAF